MKSRLPRAPPIVMAAALSVICILPVAAQPPDCRSPGLLDGIRQGIAQQTLDDGLLRLEFANPHQDPRGPSVMNKATPYGYVLFCTAELGGRLIYYGTKDFSGHAIGVWKMPGYPDPRITASQGAIVLD